MTLGGSPSASLIAEVGSVERAVTMQHLLTPCSTYARTLGLGDWLGMNKMYGHHR